MAHPNNCLSRIAAIAISVLPFSTASAQSLPWVDLDQETQLQVIVDRHVAKYLPDGRLFISFRDVPRSGKESSTKGDWVAWVGIYDDLVSSRSGQYRIRLKKNYRGSDCAYPGVELLPDGTIATTTYGHWLERESPYILSVRFPIGFCDARVKREPAP